MTETKRTIIHRCLDRNACKHQLIKIVVRFDFAIVQVSQSPAFGTGTGTGTYIFIVNSGLLCDYLTFEIPPFLIIVSIIAPSRGSPRIHPPGRSWFCQPSFRSGQKLGIMKFPAVANSIHTVISKSNRAKLQTSSSYTTAITSISIVILIHNVSNFVVSPDINPEPKHNTSTKCDSRTIPLPSAIPPWH